MIVVPVTARKAGAQASTPAEIGQPHLVLAIISGILLLAGLGLLAAAL
ncbi:hypothetical protein [Croceibacterium aestuarii]|nr:hypothetical protein [Croceibacterium sp. D39]